MREINTSLGAVGERRPADFSRLTQTFSLFIPAARDKRACKSVNMLMNARGGLTFKVSHRFRETSNSGLKCRTEFENRSRWIITDLEIINKKKNARDLGLMSNNRLPIHRLSVCIKNAESTVFFITSWKSGAEFNATYRVGLVVIRLDLDAQKARRKCRCILRVLIMLEGSIRASVYDGICRQCAARL